MSASPLRIHVQWRSAIFENGCAYNYPNKFTTAFKKRYSIPAVYRWRVMRSEPGQPEEIYIGEAEDLVQRIQRVRTPPKRGKSGETNKRLKEIFEQKISAGRAVVLDIADFELFEVNGVQFTPEGLDDRFKRRAVENLLLCEAQELGLPLLNKVLEPADKARKLLSRLSPRQLREVLREIESNKQAGRDKERE